MEQLLISLTIRTRVEPDPNAVVRALERATNLRGKLWVLGAKGSRRTLQGQQVNAFGEPERYMQYAKAGLLYYEPEHEHAEQWAFSPGTDAGTQLPLLLERYDVAFAKRSYVGEAKEQAPAQATLPMP